jgi:hypothetical protein
MCMTGFVYMQKHQIRWSVHEVKQWHNFFLCFLYLWLMHINCTKGFHFCICTCIYCTLNNFSMSITLSDQFPFLNNDNMFHYFSFINSYEVLWSYSPLLPMSFSHSPSHWSPTKHSPFLWTSHCHLYPGSHMWFGTALSETSIQRLINSRKTCK